MPLNQRIALPLGLQELLGVHFHQNEGRREVTSFPTGILEREFAGTSQSFQAESAGEWARRANARLGFWGKILELHTLENQVAFFFGSCFFKRNEKRFGPSH